LTRKNKKYNYSVEEMTNYQTAGVNIAEGDKASRLAYAHAKNTFSSRQNLIAQPCKGDDGYAGLIDMGDYFLVQNSDGVGTKSIVAQQINKFDTLGYDLLAMVVDDAVCMGAETFSMNNILDTRKVSVEIINKLMGGLSEACTEQKVLLTGGEIAELGDEVKNFTWNASSVGIVEKDKVITGKDIKTGDIVIGLKSVGFRSNGLTLVRKILQDKFGENWAEEIFSQENNQTWGNLVLTPSLIYADFLLEIIGRYGKEEQMKIKGLCHITGGGLGNLHRILPKDCGIFLDNLPTPHQGMLKLQELGNVADEEVYKVWNMGLGMAVVVSPDKVDKFLSLADEAHFSAQKIGEINDKAGQIEFISRGFHDEGKSLKA
jgi:phosphoribosylformylglycinamidine cyclo-ligase